MMFCACWFLLLSSLEIYYSLCQLQCWEKVKKTPILKMSSIIRFKSWSFWLLKNVTKLKYKLCWIIIKYAHFFFLYLHLRKFYYFLFSIWKIYSYIKVLESYLKKIYGFSVIHIWFLKIKSLCYFNMENNGDVDFKNDKVFAILEPTLHVLKMRSLGNYIDILLLWYQKYSKVLVFWASLRIHDGTLGLLSR